MFVHLPHVVIGPVLFPLQAACPLSRIIWLRSFIRSSNSYTGWQATGAGGNQWRRLWTLHFHRYTFLLTNPRTLVFSDTLVSIISSKSHYDSSCLMVGWSVRSFNHIWQVESSQKKIRHVKARCSSQLGGATRRVRNFFSQVRFVLTAKVALSLDRYL